MAAHPAHEKAAIALGEHTLDLVDLGFHRCRWLAEWPPERVLALLLRGEHLRRDFFHHDMLVVALIFAFALAEGDDFHHLRFHFLLLRLLHLHHLTVDLLSAFGDLLRWRLVRRIDNGRGVRVFMPHPVKLWVVQRLGLLVAIIICHCVPAGDPIKGSDSAHVPGLISRPIHLDSRAYKRRVIRVRQESRRVLPKSLRARVQHHARPLRAVAASLTPA